MVRRAITGRSELLGILQDWGELSKDDAHWIRQEALRTHKSDLAALYSRGLIHPKRFSRFLGNLGLNPIQPNPDKINLPNWAKPEIDFFKRHLVLPYKVNEEKGEVFIWSASPFSNDEALDHIQSVSKLKPRVVLCDLVSLDKILQGFQYPGISQVEIPWYQSFKSLNFWVGFVFLLVGVLISSFFINADALIQTLIGLWILTGLVKLRISLKPEKASMPPRKFKKEREKTMLDLWLFIDPVYRLPVELLKSFENWTEFDRYYKVNLIFDIRDEGNFEFYQSLELKIGAEIHFREGLENIEIDHLRNWSESPWFTLLNRETVYSKNWLKHLLAEVQAQRNKEVLFFSSLKKTRNFEYLGLRQLESQVQANLVVPKLVGGSSFQFTPISSLIFPKDIGLDYARELNSALALQAMKGKSALLPMNRLRQISSPEATKRENPERLSFQLELDFVDSIFQQVIDFRHHLPNIYRQSGLYGLFKSLVYISSFLSAPLMAPVFALAFLMAFLSGNLLYVEPLFYGYTAGLSLHMMVYILSRKEDFHYSSILQVLSLPFQHMLITFPLSLRLGFNFQRLANEFNLMPKK